MLCFYNTLLNYDYDIIALKYLKNISHEIFFRLLEWLGQNMQIAMLSAFENFNHDTDFCHFAFCPVLLINITQMNVQSTLQD